ncbi:sigma 54-interacting transcriptional regulator [candidate division KSB1 bacterium]|nr:sigma 54-interacting transcriptional regulator [candidate division KSB1 bacterium]
MAELYSLTSEIVKEKNRLQAIVESVADGVFTVDPQWRITSFNKAAEEITGFPRQDAIGKPCHKIFRSRVCQEACPLRRTFESGQSISNLEFEIKSKDEKPVQISVSTALLIDEEGEIIGGVETFRDLSTLKHLRDELKKRYSFANILGKNPKMLKLYDLLGAVAETSSTVLVQGETGTGKDLVARAIHYNSPRRERPFIKVSCVALPEALLESELFGHTKGAFTGADRDKPGRFELAHKGTIFLDEIGDISKPVQLKLLRVLEEGEFERLGGTKTIKVDIRVVAATNRDLQEAVKGGGFREDLFYRLNVVPIHLPPLRERNDDIPLLVEHFIEKFNKKTGKKITSVTPEVMDILVDYPWPGNIRQLENAIEHAFVHCREGVIRPAHLPEELKAQRRSLVEGVALSSSPLAKLEKQILLDVLTKNNWDRHNAAAELKISRTTLWRKTKKYGIVQKR